MVVADGWVLEGSHERARDRSRDGRDESDPVARQLRAEHVDGQDDAPSQPGYRRVAVHHLLVGENFGSTNVEGPVHARWQVGCHDEVAQHVADCNGLRLGPYPSRSDHRGKSFREVAQHLERCRPRSDDHRGAKLDGGDSGLAKYSTDLHPRTHVRGHAAFGDVWSESAEVDDAAQLALCSGLREGVGHRGFGRFQIGALLQRVHEVVGDVNPLESLTDGSRIVGIAMDDLNVVSPRKVAKLLGASG